MSTTRSARPATLTAGGILALGAVVLLAGCGGSSSGSGGSGTPSGATSSGAAAAGGTTGGGTGRGPAASGEIAAVSGTTMQVQSQQSGQVAVSWTSTTTFSQQVTLAASSIKAGDCVTAVGASGTSTSATTFSAASLSVTTATNGSCTGGFGGGGGGGSAPSGFPSGSRPSGFPSGARPSGFPSGGTARSVAIASGSVVSVSGSSVVVAARDFTAGSGSGSSTTNKTVALAATTKITGEQTATASAVKVGRCATAVGSSDSSGAVTATTIRVTDPVNGSCTSGFGGFGGRVAAGGSGA